MRIVCTQENLKSGLAIVGRIVSSSNTLPILSNILMKTENGVLKIYSTNLEVAIITQIRCRVEEDGEATVVAKTFGELINNMPNQNITIKTEGGELVIDNENYHTNLKTLPPEDFPLIPKLDNKTPFSIDSQEFKNSLDVVFFAASTNQTQPELCGVYVNLENEKLKIAATDRYRLAEKSLVLKNGFSGNVSMIIPQKTAAEISRIIGAHAGEVAVVVNSNQVGVDFNDTQIISRLVDGQYPDYKQIIPEKFSTTLILPKQPLVSALKAAAVFCQSNNSIKFNLDGKNQKLIITAESSEMGKSEVGLAASVDGEGAEIIFNHRYVLDCLNNLDTDNLVIKIVDDNSPCLILPEGQADYLYLVMPIKS
ncbi:MAG: DNA polymerase III subunit beta [Candidatus Doudnabacteria bacterium]|nr:DNA polymerase III subunit beta [Candidatus Doudnabacteria bacterium]